MPTTELRRAPREIARLIADGLDEAPEWLDLTNDADAAVAFLLDEGRGHHVPSELLWEYAAARWTELFQPPDEHRESGD